MNLKRATVLFAVSLAGIATAVPLRVIFTGHGCSDQVGLSAFIVFVISGIVAAITSEMK